MAATAPLAGPSMRVSAPVVGLKTLLPLLLISTYAAAAHQQQPHGLDPASSRSTEGFISSTQRYATLAGLEILAEGGNAADAAAAVQMALAVVQPQSTGIGGGCLVVMRNGTTGAVSALDGREEAPELFHPKVFCLDEDCLLNPECECTQGPIPSGERQIGGLAVGVPGVIAAAARLLADNGTMTLAQVLRPAIELAEVGFEMYTGMHQSIASNLNKLSRFEATRSLYLNPEGTAPRVAVGELFANPDMAATLRLLGEGGAAAFYTDGDLPGEIVSAAQDAVNVNTGKFGLMTNADLAGYLAVYRAPVLSTYRGRQLIGMPMPSSGGTALAQIFNFLEGWEEPRRRTNFQAREMSAEVLHRFIDAQNAAFADRNLYAGDADFADVPAAGLIDKRYASARRAEISQLVSAAPAPIPAGVPAGVTTRYATAPPTAENGTTHFSVVDSDGTLVAFTTTIEANWGSGVVVPNRGFLLNNELTDFAAEGLDPETGLPYANAPEGGKRVRRTALGDDASSLGGKRPRSSMTPTLVLEEDGSPLLATGSPGGSTIIAATASMLLNTLDLYDDGQGGRTTPTTSEGYVEATLMPRVMSQNGGATAEASLSSSARFVALARGFNISISQIGLVQTVGIVHELSASTGRFEPATVPAGEQRRVMTFIGACDATRQYQGESECLAQGL